MTSDAHVNWGMSNTVQHARWGARTPVGVSGNFISKLEISSETHSRIFQWKEYFHSNEKYNAFCVGSTLCYDYQNSLFKNKMHIRDEGILPMENRLYLGSCHDY